MVTIIRKFVTAIPGTHKHANNEYIQGRISAVLQIFCDPDNHMRRSEYSDGGYAFTVKTTEHMYAIAKSYIEDWYPGMCEFDVTRGFSEE